MNGKKKIIGTEAPTPYLYNTPIESIDRFRKQIKLINLLGEMRVEVIKEAVYSCYQEEPTKFRDYVLYDSGAYPEAPICHKITWRVSEPWTVRTEEEDRKLKEIIEKAKAQAEKRRR